MVRRIQSLLIALASACALAGAAVPAAAAPAQASDLSRYAVGDLQKLNFSKAGTAAPAINFEQQGGKTVSLADFKGKVVVLNLWATWCAPCIKEMPSLERLQQAFPAKDLAVIPVSMDLAGWRAVSPFWQRRGLKGITPYLDKPNALPLSYKAGGLPFTIIYDRQGKEVARIAAPAEWDSKAAKDLIGALIKAK